MRIKIITPVVDPPEELTTGMGRYLSRFLRKDTEIVFQSIAKGFRSIETEAQGIMNGNEILRLVMNAQGENLDGIFINCFDDPAVTAARELSGIPVLGPYGPSIGAASIMSERVAIITTDLYGILCEERKAKAYGYQHCISEVKAVELGVLEFSEAELVSRLTDCCLKLEAEQIRTIVLGCTGMNYVVEKLQMKLKHQNSQVQIIEPLKTGVTFLEYMIHLGYSNTIMSTPVRMTDYIEK